MWYKMGESWILFEQRQGGSVFEALPTSILSSEVVQVDTEQISGERLRSPNFTTVLITFNRKNEALI